jgi:hypothetical protein
VLEGASSQFDNLKAGLRWVCSTATFCYKSRGAENASTKVGELETNLTEPCHRLMSAISEA